MSGKVFLVGAGPGNPDLLTVKAVRVLAQADMVLHDALVSDEVLQLVSADAQAINVGKRCGHKLLEQEEINSLLIDYARKHAVVVRLKSGDPLIFGRAGEEIDALREHGIAFEIVPGITAAIAGAAAAQVSLTDRRYASQLLITTGHRGIGEFSLDARRLAVTNTTLAIYMPGPNYGQIADQLADAGFSRETPCALVSAASREQQQIERTTLGEVESVRSLSAPVVLIVGYVAAAANEHASLPDWSRWETVVAEEARKV